MEITKAIHYGKLGILYQWSALHIIKKIGYYLPILKQIPPTLPDNFMKIRSAVLP